MKLTPYAVTLSIGYLSRFYILILICVFAIRSQHKTDFLFVLREIRKTRKCHLFQIYKHERFQVFNVQA